MRYLLILLEIFVFSGNAFAGAWTQAPGDGLAIITTSYYGTDRFFDNSGHSQPQPAYTKTTLSPYLEYGWRDGTTIGANLSLQYARQDGTFTQSNWGLSDSELFLRQRLWQLNGFVLSAEPMIKLPSPERASAMPKLGGHSFDAGFGLLAGYGFGAFGLNHFVDLDTHYRYRFGVPRDQINLAATAGISLTERFMLMPQMFLTYRASAPKVAIFTESPADDYNLVQLQLSAVYKLNNGVSLQGGGFATIDGKNTGAGGGVLFSVWKTF